MKIRTLLTASVASLCLFASAPAFADAQADLATQAPVEAATNTTSEGPALWQVADEDTTIYLFGTVHVLPADLDWYGGPIADAVSSADTIVTEVPIGPETEMKMAALAQSEGTLPEGTTLRSLLTEDQRAKYEATLGAIGIPVNALDGVEPWMASLNLVFVPLLQQGYDPNSGAENVLVAKAPNKKREALETVEFQISMFDGIAQDKQIAMVMETIESIDTTKDVLDAMVAEWMDGDADGLAEIMNENMEDADVAETMLYSRNANWSDWIAKRLDTTPGTVLIAVGAGHLAGERSVQDMLESKGLTVTRVQ